MRTLYISITTGLFRTAFTEARDTTATKFFMAGHAHSQLPGSATGCIPCQSFPYYKSQKPKDTLKAYIIHKIFIILFSDIIEMKLFLHIFLLSSILDQFYACGENGNRNQLKGAEIRLLRDRTASPISVTTKTAPVTPAAKPAVAPVPAPRPVAVPRPKSVVVVPISKPVVAPVSRPVAVPRPKSVVVVPISKPVVAPVSRPVAAPVSRPVVSPVARATPVARVATVAPVPLINPPEGANLTTPVIMYCGLKYENGTLSCYPRGVPCTSRENCTGLSDGTISYNECLIECGPSL
jgi:hypothetical protein